VPALPELCRLTGRWRFLMARTGHRSVNMLRRYIRDASLFNDNAAGLL